MKGFCCNLYSCSLITPRHSPLIAPLLLLASPRRNDFENVRPIMTTSKFRSPPSSLTPFRSNHGSEEAIIRQLQQRLLEEGQSRDSAYIVLPAFPRSFLVSQLDGLTFTQFKKQVKNFNVSFTPPLPEDAEEVEYEMKCQKFKVSSTTRTGQKRTGAEIKLSRLARSASPTSRTSRSSSPYPTRKAKRSISNSPLRSTWSFRRAKMRSRTQERKAGTRRRMEKSIRRSRIDFSLL